KDMNEPARRYLAWPGLVGQRWQSRNHPAIPIIPNPAAISENVCPPIRGGYVDRARPENGRLPSVQANFPDSGIRWTLLAAAMNQFALWFPPKQDISGGAVLPVDSDIVDQADASIDIHLLLVIPTGIPPVVMNHQQQVRDSRTHRGIDIDDGWEIGL